MKDSECIGEIETTVQTFAAGLSDVHEFKLKEGALYIIAEDSSSSSKGYVVNPRRIELDIHVEKIKKFAVFAKNQIYLEVTKSTETGQFVPVCRTDTYKCGNMLSFPWLIFETKTIESDIPLRFSLHYAGKKPRVIGYFESSLDMIESGQEYEFTDKKKLLAVVQIRSKEVIKLVPEFRGGFTFLQYLEQGLQVNLVTAIDYTFSNGDPRNPRSLHYVGGQEKNQYEKAIQAVGQIVCPYDSDQSFNVLGFGGKPNDKAPVSHCFSVGDNVKGLEGIMEAYHKSLHDVDLVGPTNFAEIIHKTAERSRIEFKEHQTYTILLILTDGSIDDINNTQQELRNAASASPLSVIIVGVGTANFQKMKSIEMTDVKSDRNIVQFISFRDFQNDVKGLAATLLQEVPHQVEEYFGLELNQK